MYGHNSTAFPCAPDFQYHQGSHEVLPLQYHHDHLVSAEFSCSCSSGSSSHGASPISNRAHECYGNPAPNLIQRSVSSHSLQKTRGTHKLVSDLLESETVPVRRVYSTGDLDLQTINSMHSNGVQVVQHLQYGGYNRSSESSPLSSESSMIIEGMSKACPYSPEEKKERIERYRSKRNQRNFNKTIKVLLTDVQHCLTLGRLFELVNFPKIECMLVGRHWRTAGRASEAGLLGTTKLRRIQMFNGAT